MCLAIPMRVTAVSGFMARCEARGVAREASLFLIQHEPIAPGDLVMVHSGNVIQKMTEGEAAAAWALYDEILAAGPNEPVLTG